MSSATINLNLVEKAYNLLCDRFQQICRTNSCVVKARSNNKWNICRELTQSLIEVESLLYLPDWPYKASSTKKRVDILVYAKELFTRQPPQTIKSTVQIRYYHVGQNDTRLLLPLHYDFEVPVQPAHPVFHAHIRNGSINVKPSVLKELGVKDCIISHQPQSYYYENVRIPTPFMNLPSVLLGLTADHLPYDRYDYF